MEPDDNSTSPDEISPLTIGAPPDLLPRLLAPLGLQPSTTNLPAELQQNNVQPTLKSQQWTERVAALQASSKRAAPIPVELIIAALRDENEHVRAAAARALEKTRGLQASQPLLSALHDTSWSVRAAAAHTLGRLGSRVAIGPLIELMRNDEDEAVRASAAEALGQMREAAPLQPLLLALRDNRWLVREAAVSALGNSGQPVPREALLAASHDADISVREAALLTLQHIYPTADRANIDIAQSQTQLLSEQSTPTGATQHNSQRLLSLLQAMRRSLFGIHQPAAFNAEQETVQYVPLPTAPLLSPRPSRRQLPNNRPLLSLLNTGATVFVVAAIILAALVLFRSRPSTTVGSQKPLTCPANLVTGTSMGCAFFRSSFETHASELNAGKGINDILEIDLAKIPAPAAGKSYYAWLLASSTDPESAVVFLQRLPMKNGNIHYVYQDPQQSDLLAGTGVFLITEEATNIQPIVPSPDHSAWRYYDALSRTPDPNDTTNHYSVLDHLHHLLTADPQLENLKLHGGLGFWLQRNSQAITKLAQQAQQAFTQHNVQMERTQLINILAYLDSSVYVYKDIPAGTVLRIDPTVTRVALLTLDSLNQVPAGYLQHIAYHLNGIAANPHATSYQKKQATALTGMLSTIEAQFQHIRTDVKTLVNMKDSQLLQSTSALNTLVAQTSQVYQGQTNATTHKIQQDGVMQLYQVMQTLATFDVNVYSGKE